MWEHNGRRNVKKESAEEVPPSSYLVSVKIEINQQTLTNTMNNKSCDDCDLLRFAPIRWFSSDSSALESITKRTHIEMEERSEKNTTFFEFSNMWSAYVKICVWETNGNVNVINIRIDEMEFARAILTTMQIFIERRNWCVPWNASFDLVCVRYAMFGMRCVYSFSFEIRNRDDDDDDVAMSSSSSARQNSAFLS